MQHEGTGVAGHVSLGHGAGTRQEVIGVGVGEAAKHRRPTRGKATTPTMPTSPKLERRKSGPSETWQSGHRQTERLENATSKAPRTGEALAEDTGKPRELENTVQGCRGQSLPWQNAHRGSQTPA